MIGVDVTGLFDRMEKVVGRRLTNFIILMIAVALLSGCLSIIFNFLNPAFSWLTPDGLSVSSVINVFRLFSFAGILILLMILISSAYYRMSRAVDLMLKAESTITEAELTLLAATKLKNSGELEQVMDVLKPALKDGTWEALVKQYKERSKPTDGDPESTDLPVNNSVE